MIRLPFPRGFAVAAIAVILLTVHLDRYPAPWFDEGLNVSTAGMLAREGVYALPDSRGPRVMDAAIQTGPTVIGPAALMFTLFGTGIGTARLVVVGYALVALAAFWLAARRLFDDQTAFAASVCLLAGTSEPFASFVFMGRQVLGEVPALALVLSGLLLTLEGWSKPLGARRRMVTASAAGLLWGAAMVTKSQVLVLLPVALAAVCVLDLFYYRRHLWPWLSLSIVIGLACVAGWYAIQFLAIGEEQFRRNADVARQGFALHILSLDPAHMRNAASVIWRTGFLLWGLPGLLWGLHLARRRDDRGLRHALTLALPVVALGWFAIFSIGWGRYAFYPLALAPVWTANGVVELVSRWFPADWGRRSAGVVTAVALAGLLVAGSSAWYRQLVSPPVNGYEDMRQYLKSSVPAAAVIETWEWELSLDGGQQLRHPSTESMYAAINAYYTNRSKARHLYDRSQPMPDYVIEGPFGGWTGIYSQWVTDSGTRVATFPPYALYRIRQDIR